MLWKSEYLTGLQKAMEEIKMFAKRKGQEYLSKEKEKLGFNHTINEKVSKFHGKVERIWHKKCDFVSDMEVLCNPLSNNHNFQQVEIMKLT